MQITGSRFHYGYDRYMRFFLGGQICDPMNADTGEYYGHSSNWRSISCRIMEEKAGAWNGTVQLEHWRGTSWNSSQALQLGFDGKLSMFELYPGKLMLYPYMRYLSQLIFDKILPTCHLMW